MVRAGKEEENGIKLGRAAREESGDEMSW